MFGGRRIPAAPNHHHHQQQPLLRTPASDTFTVAAFLVPGSEPSNSLSPSQPSSSSSLSSSPSLATTPAAAAAVPALSATGDARISWEHLNLVARRCLEPLNVSDWERLWGMLGEDEGLRCLSKASSNGGGEGGVGGRDGNAEGSTAASRIVQPPQPSTVDLDRVVDVLDLSAFDYEFFEMIMWRIPVPVLPSSSLSSSMTLMATSRLVKAALRCYRQRFGLTNKAWAAQALAMGRWLYKWGRPQLAAEVLHESLFGSGSGGGGDNGCDDGSKRCHQRGKGKEGAPAADSSRSLRPSPSCSSECSGARCTLLIKCLQKGEAGSPPGRLQAVLGAVVALTCNEQGDEVEGGGKMERSEHGSRTGSCRDCRRLNTLVGRLSESAS